MNENITEEKLDKYAKESKYITYSTEIYKTTLNEREKPKIALRELTKEEDDEKEEGAEKKEKRIWSFILKYKTLEKIPQEVIIGTLDDTPDRKDKAIEIIKLLIGQLEENVVSEDGYKNYEELFQYVHNQNIPFNLTMEGAEILITKSKENVKIERTCFENEKGKIESRFDKDDIEKIKKERNTKLKKYIEEKQIAGRWKERREKIINSFDTEDEKQKFLKGENITKFLKETDKDIETKKNITANYLLEAYDEDKDEKENPKMNLLKGYLKIKEKGLAIDTKITLEELENRFYRNIKKKEGEISSEDYNTLQILEDYKTFFDLVKTGKDWNARVFALRLKNINFSNLKKVFEKFNSGDKELLNYFDKKAEMIKEVQTDNIEVDYNEHNSVKELYNFLLNSSIREKTKKDDEHVISGIYEQVKKEIIANNLDELKFYNQYAEKSGIKVCKLPKDKETARKMDTSKVAKKISNYINVKNEIDFEKNQEEMEQEEK